METVEAASDPPPVAEGPREPKRTVEVELRTPHGITAAHLTIRSTDRLDPSGAGTPRVYENTSTQFFIDGEDIIAIEPSEILSADHEPDGSPIIRRGRFRSSNFVGRVEIRATTARGRILTGALEIRSRKIDFENRYRWMLSRVAEEGAELLLQRFSPVEVALRADHSRTRKASYQQGAFISSIIRRPHTVEAIERILRDPYVSYVDESDEHPAGRGISPSSRMIRELTTPGPRVRVSGLVVPTLPRKMRHNRSVATIDNTSNRFVKFVLEQWMLTLEDMKHRLRASSPEELRSAAVRRGLAEIDELLDILEQWRTNRRFLDVGDLRQTPVGNQALNRRSGYREVVQAFAESEAAALLEWDAAEDIHRAGQQDIAQLYEYWCYLELRRIVIDHLDFNDPVNSLVELSQDGLHLRLKRGKQRVVCGHLIHAGRMIDVELWFNRTFSGAETWTLQMRPDISIRFSAQTAGDPVDTWVHFDAKYRIDVVEDLFVDDDDLLDDDDEGHTVAKAKRADLLKMHAYHDAIRSSAGSFILYPGTETDTRTKHGEILPGLGAIPFVPDSNGHAAPRNRRQLDAVFTDILDHVAHQASSRERSVWWEQKANRESIGPTGLFIPFDRPAAEVSVLIGFTRSQAHRRWAEDGGRYNLRLGDRRGAVPIDGREATAHTLLLWGPTDETLAAWTLTDHLEVADPAAMRRHGYPTEPRGDYLLRTLDRPIDLPADLTIDALRPLLDTRDFAAPVVTNWAEVLDVAAKFG